jgi:hypothetical protein
MILQTMTGTTNYNVMCKGYGTMLPDNVFFSFLVTLPVINNTIKLIHYVVYVCIVMSQDMRTCLCYRCPWCWG